MSRSGRKALNGARTLIMLSAAASFAIAAAGCNAKFNTKALGKPAGLDATGKVLTLGQVASLPAPTLAKAGAGPLTYSVQPPLPAGLTLNTATGVISGVPAAILPATQFTVTATNPKGYSASDVITITINDVPPSGCAFSANPATYSRNAAIAANTPTCGGGTVVSYSIFPALSAGLNFDTTTGAITGTPTASASVVYTVTATNSGGSTAMSLSVTVPNNPPNPPIALNCTPVGVGSGAGKGCTLVPAATLDVDGDSVTYADGGSTCSGVSVSPDGLSITYTAPSSGTCVMRVRAFDGTAYSSAVVSAQLPCPDNYVFVPGDATEGTSDFCISKFHMKAVDSGGALVNGGDGAGVWTVGGCSGSDCYIAHSLATTFPASRPDGTPWAYISRDEARQKCETIGPGYHLVTNAEWQTVARNIENTAVNWSSGVVGTGYVARGFWGSNGTGTGVNVASGLSFGHGIWSLAAANGTVAFSDANGYAGTNYSAASGWGLGTEKRRTQTLSSGDIIWDFGGNLWSWVLDDIRLTDYRQRQQSAYTLAATNNTKRDFGPQGTYGSDPYLGYSYMEGSSRGVMRGGSNDSGTSYYAGIFNAQSIDPAAKGDIGFRCVYGGQASLSVGPPSETGVFGDSSISYTVNYVNARTINLTPAAVTLNKTGTASCSVSVTNGATKPVVTLSSCTGTGTVGITINAGTATGWLGGALGSSLPSATAEVRGDDFHIPIIAKTDQSCWTQCGAIDASGDLGPWSLGGYNGWIQLDLGAGAAYSNISLLVVPGMLPGGTPTHTISVGATDPASTVAATITAWQLNDDRLVWTFTGASIRYIRIYTQSSPFGDASWDAINAIKVYGH